METVTKTYQVYTFNELSEEAQEKALRWLSEGGDPEWYDFITYDWKGKLEGMGYKNAEIQFSGFGSQGDGASFECKEIDLSKWLAEYSGKSDKYKAIMPYIEDGNSITASVDRVRHDYNHENTCRAFIDSSYLSDSLDDDNKTEAQKRIINCLCDELEKEIEKNRYETSKEIYKSLQNEFDYLQSRETLIETCEANDYRFLEDGTIQ